MSEACAGIVKYQHHTWAVVFSAELTAVQDRGQSLSASLAPSSHIVYGTYSQLPSNIMRALRSLQNSTPITTRLLSLLSKLKLFLSLSLTPPPQTFIFTLLSTAPPDPPDPPDPSIDRPSVPPQPRNSI